MNAFIIPIYVLLEREAATIFLVFFLIHFLIKIWKMKRSVFIFKTNGMMTNDDDNGVGRV